MADNRATFGVEMTFNPAPRKHYSYEHWHSSVRAVIYAKSPQGFNCNLLFQEIKLEDVGGVPDSVPDQAWEFKPGNSDAYTRYKTSLPTVTEPADRLRRMEKLAEAEFQEQKRIDALSSAFERLNAGIWSGLLKSIVEGKKHDGDAHSTLKWRLFHEKILATIKVKPELEFKGQWLWCKMYEHVMKTSVAGKHAAQHAFFKQGVRLQGTRVLEFLHNIDVVGNEAGVDDDMKFVHIKDSLEHHPHFKLLWQNWFLLNPTSTDISSLRKYFETQNQKESNRFRPVQGEHRSVGRHAYGAAALWGEEEYPAAAAASDEQDTSYWDGVADWGQSWQNEWAATGPANSVLTEDEENRYFAASGILQGADPTDETPGARFEFGDYFWSHPLQQWCSFQDWCDSFACSAILFSQASRFKNRQGKAKGGGRRRFYPKGRAFKGKKKGFSKGSSPGKGKAVSATPEEDEDPFHHYLPSPSSDNPLDHFYWCPEENCYIYDPYAETQAAAAAVKGRRKGGPGKGKGGPSPGKGPPAQKDPQGKDICMKWQNNSCTHGSNCRYSHNAPGGYKPGYTAFGSSKKSKGKGKGVAAVYDPTSGGNWVLHPPDEQQQWQQQPYAASATQAYYPAWAPQPPQQQQWVAAPPQQNWSAAPTYSAYPPFNPAAASQQGFNTANLDGLPPETQTAIRQRISQERSRLQAQGKGVSALQGGGPAGFNYGPASSFH